MKSDDDVEKLFSWLQTPDIRYREFAGAREVTDTLPTRQTRSNTAAKPKPAHDGQVAQSEAVAAPAPPHTEPAPIPVPPADAAPPSEPPSSAEPTDHAGRPLDTVFNRLAGGRGGDRDPTKGRPS